MVLQEIRKLLKYLVKPILPQRVKKFNSIYAFFILFFFSMIADYFLNDLSKGQWIASSLNIEKIDANDEEIYSKGLLSAIMGVGLVAPLLEEYTQRVYLTSFLWNQTILPLNLCLIFIKLNNIHQDKEVSVTIAVFLVISFVIYHLASKTELIKRKMMRFYIRNYWLYFYTSAIAFGFLHIGNYEVRNYIPALSIILVFSQFFGGLTLGYIRVAMGLRWSILFHALHNFFYLALLFLNHK